MSLSTAKLEISLYDSEKKDNIKNTFEPVPRYKHVYLHNYGPFVEYLSKNPELVLIVEKFNNFKKERKINLMKTYETKPNYIKKVRIPTLKIEDIDPNYKSLKIRELQNICKGLGMMSSSIASKKQTLDYIERKKNPIPIIEVSSESESSNSSN